MIPARLRAAHLTELWFHTGTACNLECPFCLEGSRPGDSRLERLTLADVRPIIEEARAHGVRQFSFTGGEPLIVKDIVRILSCALAVAPCLVLTNGTAPLIRRVHQLDALRLQPHALSFRVSLDYPDAERHDAGRGWGNFRRALEGLALLHQRGFPVSITRQATQGEDASAAHAAFRSVLVKHGLPADLTIVALPDYGLPGATGGGPAVNDDELARRCVHTSGMPLMCAQSKMILKRGGAVRVYACPLVDDDGAFDQGATLGEALTRETSLRHTRCHACIATGASMSALQ
ncbi:MAG TPA: radical SAM protein [Steroidobacteraceae bacterium]|nr:radical SAM protein [Steroidobacteraceae bacterium]